MQGLYGIGLPGPREVPAPRLSASPLSVVNGTLVKRTSFGSLRFHASTLGWNAAHCGHR
jgi:hypothetical protein